MQEYQQFTQTSCPELFEGDFKIIDWRYIYGNVGWVASRIEYLLKILIRH